MGHAHHSSLEVKALYRSVALGGQPQWLSEYISSISDDHWIARATILVVKAHVAHLAEKGFIPQDSARRILQALLEIEKNPSQVLQSGYEDVHEALEALLAEKICEDAFWVNLGKSRNDQVSAALRIKAREELFALLYDLLSLRKILASLAKKHSSTLMPGFTHFQPAQPTTLGHVLLGYEEELASHWRILFTILKEVVNRSPMGSAAFSSTTVPIDRARVAKLLGFTGLALNSMYATSSRDFLLLALGALSSLMVSMSRIAEDMVLWSSPLVGYVKPPPGHAGVSSIMPHKANPATMEILRARSGEAIGHFTAAACIVKALPSGYNLDLQEASRHLWAVLKEARRGAAVLKDFLANAEFNEKKMREDAERYPITSSDEAERRSLAGIPFRKAYFEVAAEVKAGKKPPITPDEALRMRSNRGSPNPREVERCADEALVRIGMDEAELNGYYQVVLDGLRELESLINRLLGGDGKNA